MQKTAQNYPHLRTRVYDKSGATWKIIANHFDDMCLNIIMSHHYTFIVLSKKYKNREVLEGVKLAEVNRNDFGYF